METTVHLCPSCAAHLRVTPELKLMRCNHCNAELAFIDTGGVSGLALLPRIDDCIPYSDPVQRDHDHVDGGELLYLRREVLFKDARCRHRNWSVCFVVATLLFLGTVATGVAGASQILNGVRNQTEMEIAGAMFLVAVTTLPMLMYTALYFQGRARLLKEKALSVGPGCVR